MHRNHGNDAGHPVPTPPEGTGDDGVVTSPRTVVLLGSTGSIGTQAIEVVRANAEQFAVTAIACGGSNLALAARQAVELNVAAIAVAQVPSAAEVTAALSDAARAAGADVAATLRRIEIFTGPTAAATVAASGAHVVLNGMTGSVGLAPTLAALQAGSVLALANKESLVAGGPLVRAAMKFPEQIVPVDSEHSAIAQALRAGRRNEVRRIVLTASGGPFRGKQRADLEHITPKQALAHPTWQMGPVVTVNSATLVNKGLELIEAHLLFDVPLRDIEVVVHPQSVVHSMVEFHDGSTIAQVSPPDMRLPIALGLSWPDRLADVSPASNWREASTWTFEPVDDEVFPALRLAREAASSGPTHPAVFNAANEEAVARFLGGDLPFLQIVATVAQVVAEHRAPDAAALELADVLAAETWARNRAHELMGRR